MEFERFITLSRETPTLHLRDYATFRDSFLPLALNARLRAARVLPDYRSSEHRSAAFLETHNAAWATFVENLSRWEQARMSLQLPRHEHLFIAGWQFPGIPNLFQFAKQINALLLVSQEAEWLKPLKEAGCTLNIHDHDASLQLKKNMQSGRIIAALLDHHHPGTRYQEAKLLGRTVKTPSGVLTLCIRYQYQISFIAPRANSIKIVETVKTAGMSEAELAQLYNYWLEAEILRTPEQWLMWQAFPLH